MPTFDENPWDGRYIVKILIENRPRSYLKISIDSVASLMSS
jgi:hypothetical protein